MYKLANKIKEDGFFVALVIVTLAGAALVMSLMATAAANMPGIF